MLCVSAVELRMPSSWAGVYVVLCGDPESQAQASPPPVTSTTRPADEKSGAEHFLDRPVPWTLPSTEHDLSNWSCSLAFSSNNPGPTNHQPSSDVVV